MAMVCYQNNNSFKDIAKYMGKMWQNKLHSRLSANLMLTKMEHYSIVNLLHLG